MSDTVRDCMARRGSPRFCVQVKVVVSMLGSLGSTECLPRYYSLQRAEKLWRVFLYRRPVTIRGRKMRLIHHLLQVSRNCNCYNRFSTELHQLHYLLQRILLHYPKLERGDSRRRLAIVKELHRLDVEFLQSKRHEHAYQESAIWHNIFHAEEFVQLASKLLAATKNEANPILRINAFTWIVCQRRLLPLENLSSADLLDVIEKVSCSIARDETSWAMSALVSTLAFEKLTSTDDEFQRAEKFYCEMIAKYRGIFRNPFGQTIEDFFAVGIVTDA